MNTEQLRFTLATEHRDNLFLHVIRDARDPTRQWSISSDRPWFENAPVSYAIMTRILRPPSGRFLVSIAGMTHLATSAAADFATRPAYLQELQRQAPSGWGKMNSQSVLQQISCATDGVAAVEALSLSLLVIRICRLPGLLPGTEFRPHRTRSSLSQPPPVSGSPARWPAPEPAARSGRPPGTGLPPHRLLPEHRGPHIASA